MKPLRLLCAALLFVALAARPAHATFHFMQVEQVLGGLNGLTSVQAIQLRMRTGTQNFVSQARLNVRDANGANPILLVDFTTSVALGTAGSRVLAATSDFVSETIPPLTPDFLLANRIPDSYLAAGSLTYESDLGTIYWRLSWGGAGYTGPTTGALTNDSDGNFGPPFPDPLPSTTSQALLFKNAISAASTDNAADYTLTAGTATFTNNAGQSGTLNDLAGVEPGGPGDVPALLSLSPNPVRSSMSFGIALPREMRVRVRVLDAQGRIVREVRDGILPAGRQGLTWAESDSRGPALSSGVYFLEMNAGGARLTRRFVLIKG